MIQVINRALDIIEYIATDPTEPKLMGHIAADLKLNTATCANIIKTLVNRRLLKKAIKEKGYLLGDGLSELANGSFGYKDMLAEASIEMDKVESILKENSLIAILKEDKRVVILRKNSDQLIQATTPDEKIAYDSSSGRLLIASLSDKDRELFVKRYGLPPKNIWPDADTKVKFLEQVKLIRKQGYAITKDTVQILGIATPIYRNGKVIASFSVYLPSFRFNESFRDKMIKTAVGAAKEISR
ncbi:MAG: IclR family transcriptional regulator [Daejeonella sp.]|nr:IclR family transcriptional regulator [Daejeonella sp.]